MRFPIARPSRLIDRSTLREDAMAGVVLGVESVPDGLAAGLLAGVNPLAGLYSYLYGLAGGALFTSTAAMAIQGTGAMAIIVADVDLAARDDPARALFTLSVLTGVVMVAAGLLRFGSVLRFVSNSVMTGFITAVGINIVLGQLDDFTGYAAEGGNRVARAVDLLRNLGEVHLPTLVVGALTITLIVGLQRTRLGPLGLVVAVLVGSALAALLRDPDRAVVQVRDLAEVPNALPLLTLPSLADVPAMLVPAIALAFVGLVQGAAVSAGFPNEDGSAGDESQDFVGQGMGNVVAGLFQGMPVGGSMSATSLVTSAGARTRGALLIAAGVMAVVVIAFADVIGLVAMPSLAALLIVVGIGTIRPSRIWSVARTGRSPLAVMTITLVLTMLIPLQYAVLVGVGISVALFVVQQSSRLVVKRLVLREDERVEAQDPPLEVPRDDVVVLQPYGALFFASAPTLLEQLPEVTPQSRNAVVILRIRGADDAGTTMVDVLRRYAESLRAVDSRLMVVTDSDRVIRQLRVTGTAETIGPDGIYRSTVFMGETVRRAHADAQRWVRSRQGLTR